MKNLFILRHAKANWPHSNESDFDRTLTESGLESLKKVAISIQSFNSYPELILTSNAVRTLQTTAELQNSLQSSIEIQEQSSLYLATADELLAAIQALPNSISCALLVGHNPGLEEICELLSNGSYTGLIALGTANLVYLSLDIEEWKDTLPTAATIEDLIRV